MLDFYLATADLGFVGAGFRVQACRGKVCLGHSRVAYMEVRVGLGWLCGLQFLRRPS